MQFAHLKTGRQGWLIGVGSHHSTQRLALKVDRLMHEHIRVQIVVKPPNQLVLESKEKL
jgi:hypothetical protein